MEKKNLLFAVMLILLIVPALFFSCDNGIPGTPGGPDDASLSALTVSTGTLSPSFASGTADYTVTVDSGTTSIKLTPTSTNSTAVIKVADKVVASGTESEAVALSVGLNTILIEVTSADGTTTKKYTITVTIAGVKVSGTMSISEDGFNPTGRSFMIGISTFESDTDVAYAEGTWGSEATQAFEITNVPPGTYYLYAVVDGDDEDSIAEGCYPDLGAIHGLSYNQMLQFFIDGNAPPANLVVGSEDLTEKDIGEIQVLPSFDLTVSITNAAAGNGHAYGIAIMEENEYIPGEEEAGTTGTLSGGSVTETFTMPAGESYFVFVMVDLDDSGTTGPNDGDRVGDAETGNIVSVTTVSFDYEADMEPYTGPPEDGTITVSLTNGTVSNNGTFGFGVYPPGTEDPFAVNRIAEGGGIITDGSSTGTAVLTGTTNVFMGIAGTTYPVFVLVDNSVPPNGDPDVGDYYGMFNVTINGNMNLPIDHAADLQAVPAIE